ncbi:hypothetical protein CQ13_29710 [Bradyrhizobium retamae]|uniref:Uncharacterized protein n=1 Tax=Bradyrhizobium retamae TaxID=1300035 RepID=A0A0R3MWK7_9BRAD|nr:hypothetical protein CQ13_29710 [Bradyrhizobium retamae]
MRFEEHAATCLAGAAEERDFVMHARIALIQALKRNDPPPPLLVGGVLHLQPPSTCQPIASARITSMA